MRRALLGSVRDSYPAGIPVLLTVVVTDGPWKSELSVGIDGDKGVMHYAGEDTPAGGVYSKSPSPANTGPAIYYHVSADTEFPRTPKSPSRPWKRP